MPVIHDFKVGDHVEWNSEAGRVRGTIKKRITSEITFKGYTVHASKAEPQYLIESDKTDHQAKGSALKEIGKSAAGPRLLGRIPSRQPNAFFLEPISRFRLDLTAWTLRRRRDK